MRRPKDAAQKPSALLLRKIKLGYYKKFFWQESLMIQPKGQTIPLCHSLKPPRRVVSTSGEGIGKGAYPLQDPRSSPAIRLISISFLYCIGKYSMSERSWCRRRETRSRVIRITLPLGGHAPSCLSCAPVTPCKGSTPYRTPVRAPLFGPFQ